MGVFERFGEYYDLLYQMIDYEKECNILETLFKKFSDEKSKTLLDLGCGTGSHAIILSQRGYDITGIDLSNVMIEQAKRKAKSNTINVDFLVQDMRSINLGRIFNSAICMFGGFGYVTTDQDLVDMFSGVKRHIVKDGLFIFEFWNIGGLLPSPYKTWIKIQNEEVTIYRLSESNFNPETKILTIEFEFIVIRKDYVETFQETHNIRCYTLQDMQQYLTQNGFTLLSAYDWRPSSEELKSATKNTFRILIVSKKG